MTYMDSYNAWLSSPALSDAEKQELKSIENDKKEIESRFFDMLEFGTGGLRGTMAVGVFRMNRHVIRHTTQALSELVLEEKSDNDKCIAVCFDSRIDSDTFAREAACVIAGNGIKVRLFDGPRPTPELSFAIREYGCIAGVNVTASHNPKEYNGFKVYWADGAQMPPSHAEEVSRKMTKLDIFTSIKKMDYDKAVKDGLITIMGDETDELFLKNVMAQSNDTQAVKEVADTFKLVYTPFHGAGYKLVPEALRRLGLKHIICEPEQMKLDGNFPTVASPNPENPEGFALAVALAKTHGADLIIGTDPDADRVGIMIRDNTGNYITLTGNQTGVLLLDYVINVKKQAGTMPENPAVLKSLVTTEMARLIAEKNGIDCFDTFTGFKFMAEKKNALEAAGTHKVIYSFEESYGYMVGDFVRDKDAVTASMLIAEMAAWYAWKNKTLFDALGELYEKYGLFAEDTINLVMPGLDGIAKMRELMKNLREKPPVDIAGVKVTTIRDYQTGTELDVNSGASTQIELIGSNVLRYGTADGTNIIVRPSGTEPKVKVYVLASATDKAQCNADDVVMEKITKYRNWANGLTM
ncbi:MAG: phospho-sugar mutase [Oscillospiraceae bacterium]|nr:phospho-sugar mutase [Oscillospiraceae bacterium]